MKTGGTVRYQKATRPATQSTGSNAAFDDNPLVGDGNITLTGTEAGSSHRDVGPHDTGGGVEVDPRFYAKSLFRNAASGGLVAIDINGMGGSGSTLRDDKVSCLRPSRTGSDFGGDSGSIVGDSYTGFIGEETTGAYGDGAAHRP